MASETTKPRLTLGQVERMFATEIECKTLLAKLRWPKGVRCPRCNSDRVYTMSVAFTYKCKGCNKHGYRFSVIKGTVFENTNVPLKTWFRVAFLMVSSKKGISALQVHRMIDPVRGSKGSYKTALYMCHRIRAAMKDGGLFGTLGGGGGVVEVDETYVGGQTGNAHFGNRGKIRTSAYYNRKTGSLIPPKTAVIGAIARKGNVICQKIDMLSARDMQAFVKKAVAGDVGLVASDDHYGYQGLPRNHRIPHQAVNHSKREYVRGNVHTASIDSFWSLLKRGIIGTYHKVSTDHLPLYLNEFSWRFNHRHDKEIFFSLIATC